MDSCTSGNKDTTAIHTHMYHLQSKPSSDISTVVLPDAQHQHSSMQVPMAPASLEYLRLSNAA